MQLKFVEEMEEGVGGTQYFPQWGKYLVNCGGGGCSKIKALRFWKTPPI